MQTCIEFINHKHASYGLSLLSGVARQLVIETIDIVSSVCSQDSFIAIPAYVPHVVTALPTAGYQSHNLQSSKSEDCKLIVKSVMVAMSTL